MTLALLGKETVVAGRVQKAKRLSSRDAGVGDRLANFRRERGLSQEDLARRVGLTQRVMSYYEKGTTRIPADTLLKLADVLNVSVYEILGRATSPRSPKNKKLWKVLEKIEALAPHDQKVVLRTIDALSRDAGAQ
jgi:transcriptional regulator with XRE-family HTH domain